MATYLVAALLCEKNIIDKSELEAYLKNFKEINLKEIKDEALAAAFRDVIDKISLSIETLHQPLDETIPVGPKHSKTLIS